MTEPARDPAAALRGKRLAVLGVGTIGEALLRGLARVGLDLDAVGTTKRTESHARVEGLGVAVAPSNREAVAGRDLIVLAVKPQVMPAVLDEIAGHVPR